VRGLGRRANPNVGESALDHFTVEAGGLAEEDGGRGVAVGDGFRWVNQYNFYLQDAEWGTIFVRVCPHFPFSTRICLNQHHWLAHQMKQAGIRFQQSGNAFRRCSDPEALQKIADSPHL